jgi:hypothetical protein
MSAGDERGRGDKRNRIMAMIEEGKLAQVLGELGAHLVDGGWP